MDRAGSDWNRSQFQKRVPGEAVLRVRLTTICGTDIHIVRGEYPVVEGLTIGHEATGVIHELGPGVSGYSVGQRVMTGAITPCGQCEFCLGGNLSQCGGSLGGWKLGNTIDGVQAEYVRIPHAQANLAAIPDELRDEQVLLLADIASTGFSAVQSGGVRLGDTVAVFAQGPIELGADTRRASCRSLSSRPSMPTRGGFGWQRNSVQAQRCLRLPIVAIVFAN